MNRPRHFFKIFIKPLDGTKLGDPAMIPMEAALLDWPAFLVLKAEIERVEAALRAQNEPQQLGLPETGEEQTAPRLEGF